VRDGPQPGGGGYDVKQQGGMRLTMDTLSTGAFEAAAPGERTVFGARAGKRAAAGRTLLRVTARQQDPVLIPQVPYMDGVSVPCDAPPSLLPTSVASRDGGASPPNHGWA